MHRQLHFTKSSLLSFLFNSSQGVRRVAKTLTQVEVNLDTALWHWSSHVVVHCWTYSGLTQNMAIAKTSPCSVSRRVWELAWNRPLFVPSEPHTGPSLLFVLCLFHWQTHINKRGIRPESSGSAVCVFERTDCVSVCLCFIKRRQKEKEAGRGIWNCMR